MKPEVRNEFDYPAIREVGDRMLALIDGIPAEGNRQVTIEELNRLLEEIPYDALLTRLDEVNGSIEEIDEKHAEIDQRLSSELSQITALTKALTRADTFRSKTFEAQAKTKKQEAVEKAEEEKQPTEETYQALTAEKELLEEALKAVTEAWPLTPYETEIEIDQADEVEVEPSEINRPTTGILDKINAPRYRSRASARTREAPVSIRREPGPYEDLAKNIPDLASRLEGSESVHLHVYGSVETAADSLEKIENKPTDERTEEEVELWKAVYVLRVRFLRNSNDLRFLKVYEPADIITLAQNLHQFSKKDRPDFNDLEGRILDIASKPSSRRDRYVAPDVKDAKKRAEEGAENRRGMTWQSLCRHANTASNMLEARLQAGGQSNLHLKDYKIDIVDKSDKKPDLSWVYQFIANEFAIETLGKRQSVQQNTVKDRFISNCDVIDSWLEESKELLDQLPKDFKLKKKTRRQSSFKRQESQESYYSSSAGWLIQNMIDDIKIRRDGTGDPKVARHKSMELDHQGALNHQLRLGHLVTQLKEELVYFGEIVDGHSEDIVPFE